MTTKKAQHTTGSWHQAGVAYGISGQIFDQDKNSICLTDRGSENWSANARLIAAAPELLSALKELLSCYDYLDDGQCEEFTLARLAIEKAEGYRL